MPTNCVCGTENSINHSLICKTGGYTIFRHNIVRDTIAEILKEICKDVKVEPELIPIDSDHNFSSSENLTEKARLDVSCVGLWSPLEKNFLFCSPFCLCAHRWVRVFHSNAPSYQNKPLKTLYRELDRLCRPS